MSFARASGLYFNGQLSESGWRFESRATAELWEKLKASGPRLLNLPAAMSRGSSTGDDESFLVPLQERIERQALRVPLFATDFNRHSFAAGKEWRIIFPYEIQGDEIQLLSERDLKRRFPLAFARLKSRQAQLRRRKQYSEWYAYSAPRNLVLHDRAQIAVPLLAERGSFTLIPSDVRGALCPMASGGFTVTIDSDAPVSSEYVLGLLNSRVLFWVLRHLSNVFRGGWITCTKQYFGELPIALPGQSRHDRIVRFVGEMLDSKRLFTLSKSDKDRNYYFDCLRLGSGPLPACLAAANG